jgi:putative hydrolase of the HAD superfamily
LIGVPDGNHDLLLKIKAQYPTFLLSNNNEIHYDWIMKYLKADFGLADNSSFFIKDYYSHLLRMRKPNHDIFEYVLDTHQLKPEETLFIDDSPQHLKTAQELGLQTYLMTAPDNLQLYFSKNGLLRAL